MSNWNLVKPVKVTRVATVTARIPDAVQLTPPAHWTDATVAAARDSGWEISYALTADGVSAWDCEAFSHMPDSLQSPPAEVVAANAPEWWDADNSERYHLGITGRWFPLQDWTDPANPVPLTA
jgi:hypothetical protein